MRRGWCDLGDSDVPSIVTSPRAAGLREPLRSVCEEVVIPPWAACFLEPESCSVPSTEEPAAASGKTDARAGGGVLLGPGGPDTSCHSRGARAVEGEAF